MSGTEENEPGSGAKYDRFLIKIEDEIIETILIKREPVSMELCPCPVNQKLFVQLTDCRVWLGARDSICLDSSKFRNPSLPTMESNPISKPESEIKVESVPSKIEPDSAQETCPYPVVQVLSSRPTESSSWRGAQGGIGLDSSSEIRNPSLPPTGPMESDQNSTPTPTVDCPICGTFMQTGPWQAAWIESHLAKKHRVRNLKERSLLCNLAQNRVNIKSEPCPVPGCGHEPNQLVLHLKGHQDLKKNQIDFLLKCVRLEVTKRRLASLRLFDPMPPLVSTLDLGAPPSEVPPDRPNGPCRLGCCQLQAYELEKARDDISALTSRLSTLTAKCHILEQGGVGTAASRSRPDTSCDPGAPPGRPPRPSGQALGSQWATSTSECAATVATAFSSTKSPAPRRPASAAPPATALSPHEDLAKGQDRQAPPWDPHRVLKLSRVIPRGVLRRAGRLAMEAMEEALSIAEQSVTSRSQERLYGYMMVFLSTLYGHRGRVFQSMLAEEVEAALPNEAPGVYLINVENHPPNQPMETAQMALTEEEYGWFKRLLSLRAAVGVPSPYLFFPIGPGHCRDLVSHLQGSWREMGLPGAPSFSQIRTSIAFHAKSTHTATDWDKVARFMAHDASTADQLCALNPRQVFECRRLIEAALEDVGARGTSSGPAPTPASSRRKRRLTEEEGAMFPYKESGTPSSKLPSGAEDEERRLSRVWIQERADPRREQPAPKKQLCPSSAQPPRATSPTHKKKLRLDTPLSPPTPCSPNWMPPPAPRSTATRGWGRWARYRQRNPAGRRR